MLPALLGRVVGGAALGGAIKGGLGALGNVVGGIVSAAGSVLGGVLNSLNSSNEENTADVTIINNIENRKKGYGSNAGKTPKIKQATRIAVNDNMSADQLLRVAVNYLSVIDENMKNKMVYDEQTRRLDMAAQREEKIENEGAVVLPFKLKSKQEKKNTETDQSSSIMPMVIKFGGIAAGLALVANQLGFLDFDFPSLKDVLSGKDPNESVPVDVGGASVPEPTPEAPTKETATQKDGSKVSEKDITKVPNDAYDIVYGNGIYGSPEKEMNKNLTDMTISEVLQFQTILFNNTKSKGGTPHTPVGAYQFTKDTLKDLAPDVLGKNWRNQKFDKKTQDKLAEARYNQIGDLSKLHKVWSSMPRKDYSGKKFSDVKDEIVQREVGSYVGMAPAEQTQEAGMLENAGNSIADLIQLIRDIKPDKDSTFKPTVTSAEPNYEKYNDLYYKNLEMENNTIAGMKADREKNKQSGLGNLTASQSALAEVNSGSLDVINPNYRLSDNAIIMDYLGNFGYSR